MSILMKLLVIGLAAGFSGLGHLRVNEKRTYRRALSKQSQVSEPTISSDQAKRLALI